MMKVGIMGAGKIAGIMAGTLAGMQEACAYAVAARELERAEKLLTGAFPPSDWELRAPAALTEKGALWAFGMADWFDAGPAGAFGEKAYLGLAFD